MTQQVRDVMTAHPATVKAHASIKDAARVMREQNIGDVIISDEGKVRGIVTDRDIAVRAVADDRPGSTPVEEVCSHQTFACSPGDGVDRAVALMREHSVRRLPVVDEGKLVGVVSIGDLAMERDSRSALADISAASPNR
jgi:CBS domain-containing protein